ncbi:MAG: hypothetical protein ACXVX7_16090 [Mycobacterium sp.]
MDVVLGVAVTGPVARLALVGQGADVIDQSVLNLGNHPIEKLTETVVGTNRMLADEQHRLVATRLCWPADPQADQLRRALEDSGVRNVEVLSQSQAVSALMRAAGRAGGVLVVDDNTATLSLVGSATDGHHDADAPPTVLASGPLAAGPGASGADATAALDTMMARLGDHPGDLYLLGASPNLDAVADQLRDASTMRVEIPDDPTFALARGAALAAAPEAAPALADATALAPALGDATALAPVVGDATALAPAVGLTGDETAFAPAAEVAGEEPQLAYSMADEGQPLDMEEFGPDSADYLEDAEGEPARLSRRSLLIGNAVIAFAVIGMASLAAAVAIAIRPTAAAQPVIGHQNAAPGKFMPLLPTQQQAPVPPPPVNEPNAGFQGGTIPAPTGGGSVPQQVPPPVVNGTPAAPVGPETPGTPGFVPNPNVPIPVPIIIPFPGWRPPNPYNPYPPPYTPPTTTVSPPTTTYSPPTTTVSPPTTSYSPPTTTYSPPTTSYSPPTTTYSPPTTSYSPPPTSYSPPPSSYSPPHNQTQQTVPPQTHSQQPVVPQQPQLPHRGGGTGGGSGGGGTGGGGGHHGFGF